MDSPSQGGQSPCRASEDQRDLLHSSISTSTGVDDMASPADSQSTFCDFVPSTFPDETTLQPYTQHDLLSERVPVPLAPPQIRQNGNGSSQVPLQPEPRNPSQRTPVLPSQVNTLSDILRPLSELNGVRRSPPQKQHVVQSPSHRPLGSLVPPPLLPPSRPNPPAKRARLDGSSDGAETWSSCLPLSGLARPLPPPTPSPTVQRLIRTNAPLRPLKPPSIADMQRILPPQRPPPAPPRRMPAQPPPVPTHEEIPWSYRCLATGFEPLDQRFGHWFAALKASQQEEPDAGDESIEEEGKAAGLASGSFLEVVGPPGSGKSSFCVQAAIRERVDSLVFLRLKMNDAETSGDVSLLDESYLSALFSEEYWDAELTAANQVFLIDTEGGLLPERVLDTVWAHILPLWTRFGPSSAKSTDREEVPENVRRCVAATLQGLHISRVTQAAELVALLSILRQPDEEDKEEESSRSPLLPERISLIIIDSLSHCLRSTTTSQAERTERAKVLDQLGKLQFELSEPHRRKLCSTDPIPELYVPTVICTNQMGVRMFTPDGSSANFTSREASAVLMPQLAGPRRSDEDRQPSVALEVPNSSGSARGGGSASLTFGTIRRAGSGGAAWFDVTNWGPSVLGPNVWRLMLFRDGPFGDRYAQVATVPRDLTHEMIKLADQVQRVQDARSVAVSKRLRTVAEETHRWMPFRINEAGLEPL